MAMPAVNVVERDNQSGSSSSEPEEFDGDIASEDPEPDPPVAEAVPPPPEEEPVEEEEGGPGRRDLKALAKSQLHLMTHLPKNPYCQACQMSKMKQAYSKRGAFQRELDHFGAIIPCDHLYTGQSRMQGCVGRRMR